MDARICLAGLSLLFALPSFGGEIRASLNVGANTFDSPPNFLVFVLDDVGSSNFEGFGGQYEADITAQNAADPTTANGVVFNKDNTPNIFWFKQYGVAFTQFRTNPLCAASRASLWSGLSNPKNGQPYHGGSGWNMGYSGELAPGNGTWVRLSEEAGYDTYGVGKFGVTGLSQPSRGNGGSTAYGIWADEGDFQPVASTVAPANHGGTLSSNTGDVLTQSVVADDTFWGNRDKDNIIEWLDSRDGTTPWLAYVGFNWPHMPVFDSIEPLGTSPPPSYFSDGVTICNENPDTWSPCFENVVQFADWIIGQVWNSLTAEVKAKTVVIIIGDNGSESYYYGNGPEGPLFNGKGSIRDGGERVPLIIGGGIASQKKGTEFGYSTSIMDLGVTMVEMAGLNVEPQGLRQYDGASFADVLDKSLTPTEAVSEFQILTLFKKTFQVGPTGNPGNFFDASDPASNLEGISVIWSDPDSDDVWKLHRLSAGCAVAGNNNTRSECNDRLYKLPDEVTSVRGSYPDIYAKLIEHMYSKFTPAVSPCVEMSLGQVWSEPIMDFSTLCGF